MRNKPIQIKCFICKKKFKRCPAHIKRRKIHVCSLKCRAKIPRTWNTGTKHPKWRGGRWENKRGYVLIYKPKHPHAQQNGYILEHRYVMEQKIGRYLRKNESVHHKNKIKNDNRRKNLKLMTTSQHTTHHHTGNQYWKKRKRNKIGQFI